MLKRLVIENLTVFKDADIEFADGLNVIIGENGTGKSHILKAVYSVLSASCEVSKKAGGQEQLSALRSKTAEKLVNVFRSDTLGRLARRRQGRAHCSLSLEFDDAGLDCALGFSTLSRSEVRFEKMPAKTQSAAPVFFPTRELLTLYPNFVSFYESHYLPFEETYRDTCLLLGAPALKGPKSWEAQALLSLLEDALGGRVVLDAQGRFYLNVRGSGNMEMPLVAEGLRKLAMAAQLIGNGSLRSKGYFFWDEPECNLNPKLILLVARIIVSLCKAGIQLFIATHSLFLLRELEILLSDKEFSAVSRRFIGLIPQEDSTIVEQADDAESLSTITMLDEEIAQSDRYLKEVD